MINYTIYEGEFGDYIVEIFNRGDIVNVQNQLTQEGYMIEFMISTNSQGHAFMKVYKEEKIWLIQIQKIKSKGVN